jgi:hypothetical protein
LTNFRNRVVQNLENVEERSDDDDNHSPTAPTVIQSNLFKLVDLRWGTSSAFKEPSQEEIEFHRKKYYVDGHTPLTDPKRKHLFDKYLVGSEGFTSITEATPEFLTSLGFDNDEAKRTIMRGLFFLINSGNKPDIAPKCYSSFQQLEELNMEEFVDFYGHLVISLKRHGIGLLDFDHVQPKWLQCGLAFPGIGEENYLIQAEPLFNVLEKILPSNDPIVKQCTNALVGKNHDGFKLLRDIMGKAIPVFCPYLISNPPLWRKYKDVSQMAKMWQLHFRLQRKTGSITSPTQQSLQFLQSLAEPSLSANITSIRGQIQLYTESINTFEDSLVPLPSNLTIEGITNTLTAFPNPIESYLSTSPSHTIMPMIICLMMTLILTCKVSSTPPQLFALGILVDATARVALKMTRRQILTPRRILFVVVATVRVTRKLIVALLHSG